MYSPRKPDVAKQCLKDAAKALKTGDTTEAELALVEFIEIQSEMDEGFFNSKDMNKQALTLVLQMIRLSHSRGA